MRALKNGSVQAMALLKCVAEEISNNRPDYLKFVFEMSSACLNAGPNILMSLFDHFINDRQLELFPLFDQA